MTLAAKLAEREIATALIVDDAYDDVPKATDVGLMNEEWANFVDDVTAEGKALIAEVYPAGGRHHDQLIREDGYVAAIWGLKDRLGEPALRLFEGYVADMHDDRRYVELVKSKLEANGIRCETAGRDFVDKIESADLVVIDLFLGKAQDATSMTEAKSKLREALDLRRADPPLVLLMSRSPRIDTKRDEFRDEVGLIESAFRIIRKTELETGNKFETQLERLADNAPESRQLARFFDALNVGMKEATLRTLKRLRRLRLSDVGQIQQLLLNAEGEPAGSYLVDVFDRILQHEIEAETGIIDAALPLNAFKAANHPPPYVAGSPELQDLVRRTLTQHQNRLKLPGSENTVVTFGDVLQIAGAGQANGPQRSLLVDVAPDEVMVVLTPACDLQRDEAPRILVLVGKVKALGAKDWSYSNDARTPCIRIGEDDRWIKWNLKHIDTVSKAKLETALGSGEVSVVARLREAHALELQQRVLAGLGRVGLVAKMPATFAVEVKAYYAAADGRATLLDVPEMADGAVCFVGRDEDGNQVIRLVMTEGYVDGIQAALGTLEEAAIAEPARTAFGHVTRTEDLRRMLTPGYRLKEGPKNDWVEMPSLTGANAGVPKMGLIAWNYDFPDEPIDRRKLSKAGIILSIKDLATPDSPALERVLAAQMNEPVREETAQEA